MSPAVERLKTVHLHPVVAYVLLLSPCAWAGRTVVSALVGPSCAAPMREVFGSIAMLAYVNVVPGAGMTAFYLAYARKRLDAGLRLGCDVQFGLLLAVWFSVLASERAAVQRKTAAHPDVSARLASAWATCRR